MCNKPTGDICAAVQIFALIIAGDEMGSGIPLTATAVGGVGIEGSLSVCFFAIKLCCMTGRGEGSPPSEVLGVVE